MIPTPTRPIPRPPVSRAGLTLLTAASVALPASALTVRVDPGGGAPRIVVDGRPVRARMFWGAPGTAPLPVSATGEWTSFDFTSSGSATNGTLHFRFGETPGEIVLDDIRLTDLDTGREVIPACDFEGGAGSFGRAWTFWPPGPANTVGTIDVVSGAGSSGSAGLRIGLKPPPGGDWPDFHIYHHADLVMEAGHRYRAQFWARAHPPRKITTSLYRPGSHYELLGGPQNVFERQIRLAAGAGVRFVSFPVHLPWPRPGEAVDWAGLDAACRRVLAANPDALLLPRVPMDPPEWWREAHPDEVMQWEDGRRDKAVPASPVYRRDAAARLAALVEHLESTLGGSVAGYHPCGQNTGEWFYQDTWRTPLSGYAPADRTGWQAWLGRHYTTDDALRSAWTVADTTRGTAAVPPVAERRASPAGCLRDPARERRLIDFAAYQQDAMADCVCDLARAVRTASRGRKLVVFFFGYVFEFAPVSTGPAVSGHYASRRVIDCPDIDVLCSPISYHDRGLGQGAPSMSAAESVALAGKLWLNEDDTHTYLATGTPPGARDHVDTLDATNAQLVRNVAQESLRNFGTWWMDLGASGWFDDPGMWREMVRLSPLDDAMLAHPTPFRPEVAAVIDEQAMLRVTPRGSAATRAGVYEARTALGRMGAPYGQYLVDDLLAGRLRAKLYVLLNPWDLDAGRRAAQVDATRGAGRIWCHVPDDPAGPAAGEVRRADDGLHVLMTAPGLTSDLLRRAAREAGVHLFATNDCNVYANAGYVALHAPQDGPLDLFTGRDAAVTDVLTGAPVGRGPVFRLDLRRGDTRVLRY